MKAPFKFELAKDHNRALALVAAVTALGAGAIAAVEFGNGDSAGTVSTVNSLITTTPARSIDTSVPPYVESPPVTIYQSNHVKIIQTP